MNKQQKQELENAFQTIERYSTAKKFEAQLYIEYIKALKIIMQAEKNLLLPTEKQPEEEQK